MKRILLGVILFLPLLSNAQNLTPAWVAAIGGTGDDVVQSTVVDASGFVYIGGSFSGTVNFNPNGTITSLISNGETDAFFGKYTSSGLLVWIKQLGDVGSDEIYALDVDGSHVYVAGYFNNTVDFDPSAASANLTSGGFNDIFYGKYTTAGLLVWANAHGSTDYDQAIDIKVDASGNVYVTGFFEGTVDFDPSNFTTDFKTATGGSGYDIFLCKYSPSGAKVWIDTFGSVGTDLGVSIDLDASNVYIAGLYSDGDLDFDPSGGLASVSNLGGSDAFFGKYLQSNGSFLSGATIRSDSEDEASSIVVSGTNVYIGGKFSSSASFYSMSGNVVKNAVGDYDIFVAKYDFGTATPTLTWLNQMGGSLDDGLNLLTSDASGNVYCTGYFQDVADFDPSPASTLNLIASGLSDVYIASYSATGLLRFAKSIGDVDYDEGATIALDPTNSNSLYVGGYFQATASFDFSSSSQNKTSAGLKDGYVTKYTLSTLDAEPTAQPTNLTFNTITDTGFMYDFTASTGSNITGYIHIRKSGSAPTFVPLDGTSYTLDQVLPDGSIVEYTDNFPSGDLSSLVAGTTYYIKIFAFNGSGASINYLATNPLSGNVTTTGGSFAAEPTNSPTNLVFSSITATGYSFIYTAAVAGTTAPDGYIGIRRTGSAPTGVPVDGTTYSVGDFLGDGAIRFIGALPGGGYGETDGVPSTTYHFVIYSYKGSGTAINYKQVSPLTGSVTTLVGEPTAQPTLLVFGTSTSNSIPVSFTAPSTAPAGYIAIRKAGSAPTSDPVDGTGYVAGAILGDGVVAYSGAAALFTDTGLAANTTYFYKIYSFNGAASTANYLTTSTALSGNKATAAGSLATDPSAQPTAISFGTSTSTTIPVSFSAPATPPAGYIAIRRAGAAPSTDPVDGNAYTTGAVLGDGVVAYSGSTASFTDTGLTASTTYFYKVYSFNGSATTTNYLTSITPLSGSKATTGALATEPTAQPTALTFSNQTSSSFDYQFTAATGSPTGYIVIRSAGSAVTGIPVDGTEYTLDEALGNGFVRSTTATGGTLYTAGSLTASTTYHTAIFAFNGSGTSINYRQVSPLIGSTATTSAVSLATEPSNSPTGLVFSDISSSSYEFSFTAAATGTTAPDGYIGIRREGSAPTSVPVDGVTYVVEDVFGNGFINFVGTGTTYTQSSASSLSTYHLAIYSYKGSGTSINYKQVSPLTGSVTTLTDVDISPPTITANTTPTTSLAGQTVKVSITASDPESGIVSAEIDYGVSSSVDWTELDAPMTNTSGNVWEFTIPASVVKELGFEYRVTVYNGVGDEADTGIKGVTITTDANGPSVPFSGAGTEQSNYKIISIPLALESKTVNKVFGDDLGDYGDKSKWRMFRYSGNKTTELSGSSSINPGEAYWFISSTNANIDTGVGATIGRISDPFTMQVSQGFNQIGNPYVINLLWTDVQTYSFDTDDNSDLGLGKLRVFSGGSFADGTVLKRFEGGFVMAASAGTLVFPAEKNPAAGRTENQPVSTLHNSIDGTDWEVNFELTNGIQNMNFSGIGMNQKANDAYDVYDDFTLPRFMDYIELNHASKELFNISYTKDIVPTSENHTWEFFVESNSNELVTMNWDNSYFGNNSKQLVLWDVNLQRGLDMRKESKYSFSKSRSGHLKVFYGDEQYVKEKTAISQMVFHDVFPNPAKDIVTISFSIPKEDRVTIDVFDLMGRKVATVADGNFKAGYHEVSWNTLDGSGSAVTNGIYITQIKGLNSDHQKRLSINK